MCPLLSSKEEIRGNDRKINFGWMIEEKKRHKKTFFLFPLFPTDVEISDLSQAVAEPKHTKLRCQKDIMMLSKAAGMLQTKRSSDGRCICSPRLTIQ